MGYKAFASMGIAIIGSEKTTSVLAQGLALAGHEIYIGIKEDESIQLDFLPEEFPGFYVTTIEEAGARADLIIMATAPDKVREASYLLDDVRSKSIIDASFMNNMIPEQYLNTLSAIKAITGSQSVVKCFYAKGFEPVPSIDGKENDVQMYLAGDDRKAKELARIVSRDLEYGACYDFGGSDSVSLLDEMAICYHQLGAAKEQAGELVVRIMKD